MEAAFVFICLFIIIFGIAYLHYSTRNKERLALIEKGADASIFGVKRSKETPPVWKILILNIGLLCMGIGIGIFFASLLVQNGMNDEVAYPGTIFLVAGISLVSGFFMTKKLIK